MITLTIHSDSDRQFRIRFQHKLEADVWTDSEVHTVTGDSQPYGIDKRATRLIVEDLDGVPLNVVSERAV